MYLINQENYKKIEALIHPSCMSLQLKTVVTNQNPGVIFANKEQATSAVVYHQGEGGFFFVGKPNQEFFKHVINNINSIHFNGKLKYFEFSFDSTEWQPVIESLKTMNTCEQFIYFSDHKTPLDEVILNDIQIIPISKNTLNYSNCEFVTEPILEWWNSLDDYFNENLGFVALDNNKIVGRCLLDGKTDTHMGIGIAVEESYRKKNIATALAIKMVNAIHQNNYSVYWECTDDNYGSQALTNKTNLVKKQAYRLYWKSL